MADHSYPKRYRDALAMGYPVSAWPSAIPPRKWAARGAELVMGQFSLVPLSPARIRILLDCATGKW